MKLTIEQENDAVVVLVQEERLDAHNSEELKACLLGQLNDGNSKIIVELKEVHFIDSSGLGALLAGYKNAVKSEGTLALAGLQPQVRSLFDLTRLHRVFQIYPDRQEALEKL